MWQALVVQYDGKRFDLKYNAITNYTTLKYEDHTDLISFAVAFRKSIEKMASLKISPPEEWHLVMFINALAPSWPVWAEQQRSQAQNQDTSPTLENLINDITDDAGTRATAKAEGSALFGEKGARGAKKKG